MRDTTIIKTQIAVALLTLFFWSAAAQADVAWTAVITTDVRFAGFLVPSDASTLRLARLPASSEVTTRSIDLGSFRPPASRDCPSRESREVSPDGQRNPCRSNAK